MSNINKNNYKNYKAQTIFKALTKNPQCLTDLLYKR